MTTTTAIATAPYPTKDIIRALAAANDRPHPALDAGYTPPYELALRPHCTAQKHAGRARGFRASAWKHMDEGDLPRASLKGWELVVETVKAISARYNRVIYTPSAIVAVIDQLTRLVDAAGDAETRRRINLSFHVARSLYNNSGTKEFTDTIVRDGLETCEELSDLLYQLFWPGGLLAPAHTVSVKNTMTTTTPYSEQEIAAAIARALDAAKDRSRPGPDANRSAQNYAAMARDFRASAWKHMDVGDLPQASLKGWELVVETVKAISARYNRVIYYTPSTIVAVIDQLTRLAGDAGDAETRRGINLSFHVARSLHTNFYENEMQEATVRDGLKACEELSDRLYLQFWPEGAAADGSI